VWTKGEVYTGFWWGSLRERDHLEDPGVEGMIISRLIFRKWDEGAWSGSICLKIGNAGNLLTSREMVSFLGRTLLQAVSK
jgi:hypothetical protein